MAKTHCPKAGNMLKFNHWQWWLISSHQQLTCPYIFLTWALQTRTHLWYLNAHVLLFFPSGAVAIRREGKKKREKESALVFLSSTSSFLRCATSLEVKEQKTFFLLQKVNTNSSSDFLRPQYPLPVRQGMSTLHDLGTCQVQNFTLALRLFFYC